jgi:sucrose phosphorylase
VDTIKDRLKILYPGEYESLYPKVCALIEKWNKASFKNYPELSEKDIALITYGDAVHSGKKGEGLKMLNRILTGNLKGIINIVHILPMFPYTSDDGFSVVDYRAIDENLGAWDDIAALSENFDLMFDAVLNHCSVSSAYFKGFFAGDPKYKDFFIACDPAVDYSAVARPRALPLLTAFETSEGEKHIWTTFSDDQVDLNYQNPEVLLEMLDVLLMYAQRGARFIRLDAIGYLWKKAGTNCFNLPEVHEFVKLSRSVLNLCSPKCAIITETNVAHKENISYFGNGDDEASLVYQFPLPPLTLFSFISGNAEKLTRWAEQLEPAGKGTAFFNFLASHDGIGMRPTEGILTAEEKQNLVDAVQKRGGKINYRSLPDGQQEPYELNITYMDALSDPGDSDDLRLQRFIAAHALLLSLAGLPAIYYNSLFGSRNDYKGLVESGINRRINREKFEYEDLAAQLADPSNFRYRAFSALKKLIEIRKTCPQFAPSASQKILHIDPRVFAFIRKAEDSPQSVLVLINVSCHTCTPVLDIKDFAKSICQGIRPGIDLISGENTGSQIELPPYGAMWIIDK